MSLDIRGFERVRVQDLLVGLEVLPSLIRHLESEIGACMRRVNVHLDSFADENGTALDWLVNTCTKTFTPVATTIWLRETGTDRLRVAAFLPGADTPSNLQMKRGSHLSEVVRHRVGIRFDPSLSGCQTGMMAPLILGQQLLGVTQLQTEEQEFGEDDLGTLSLLTEVFTLGCFLALNTAGHGRHLADLKKAA